MVDRPLLERYPALAARFMPLLKLPTPVVRVGDVWVKHDGLMGAPIGGSKARTMEFCLRDFIECRRTVVAFGPFGSNWLTNLAWASRTYGFPVAIWTFPQDLNDHASRNRELLRPVARHTADLLDLFARGVVRGGRFFSPRTRISPMAGSAPRSIMGHVNAMMELKRQINAGELPMPVRIVVALGSGGTSAGLLAGSALLGLDIEIVSVRVTSHFLANRWRVVSMARKALNLLGSDAPLGRLSIIHKFAGTYGRPMPEATRARARFAEAGVELDDSYTAKAALALSGRGPTLFWNTFAPRS